MSLSSIPPAAVILGSLMVAVLLNGLAPPPAVADANHALAQTRGPKARDASQQAQLKVLDWALWNVSKYYVEPERIHPKVMRDAGLKALERSIPEVMVELSPKSSTVKVRVGSKQKEFRREVNALWSVRAIIRDVFGYVQQNLNLNAEQRRDAEYNVVDRILATLDPHTNLMRPDAFTQLKESTSGSFGGLGIEVGIRNNAITILRVLAGNPAEKAGLLAGDRIVQIDDESAVAMGINDAVTLLRGAPGSTVRLKIERGVDKKVRRINVVRAQIRLESVSADLVPAPGGAKNDAPIGVLRLSRNFARDTGKEVRKALKQFEKTGVQGLVLDMRSNPGGLLDAAVEVADAFLSAGTIVSTVGGGTEATENQATQSYDFPNLPIAVLVDQSSASATEIVAGALRNLDRAVIIGRRTFGKGSVQVPHARRVGDEEIALKLTIAQYLTPGGVSIQSVGVLPDLVTWPVVIGKDDVAYYSTKRFDVLREESLASHLDSSSVKQQETTAGPLFYLYPERKFSAKNPPKRLEELNSPKARAAFLLEDPEIKIARNLVAWAPSPDRLGILKKLPDFSATQQLQEDEAIDKALKKRGVDWSLGPKPAAGQSAQLEVEVKNDSADKPILGGKSRKITVTVHNRGSAPAYRVRTMASTDNPVLDEQELVFGKIAPGGKKSATFEVSVGARERSRSDRIDLRVYAAYSAAKQNPKPHSFVIARQGLERPDFVFGYQVIDDPKLAPKSAPKSIAGNASGSLQVGEKALLRVHIKNRGPGDAPKPYASIRAKSGEGVFLKKSRQTLKAMPSGQDVFVDFPFEVRRAPPKGEATLRLTIIDNERGEYLTQKITLPVTAAAKTGAGWGENPKANQTILQGPLRVQTAPFDAAAPLAQVPKTVKVTVVERKGEWSRVRLGNTTMGFVKQAGSAGQGSFASGAPTKKLGSKVQWNYAITPPTIELSKVPKPIPSQVNAASIRIEGVAKDEQKLRDLYIAVLNPGHDIFALPQKVFYQANEGADPRSMSFSAEVPLTPGNNLIEIQARENDEVIAHRRMWVLSTAGLEQARRQQTAMHQARQRKTGSLPH